MTEPVSVKLKAEKQNRCVKKTGKPFPKTVAMKELRKLLFKDGVHRPEYTNVSNRLL